MEMLEKMLLDKPFFLIQPLPQKTEKNENSLPPPKLANMINIVF